MHPRFVHHQLRSLIGRPTNSATPNWATIAAPIACSWYAQRWKIEVLHKVLKSGCQIEQRQLETAARLERALAVDQVVAWRLLALCKAAREQPEAPVGAWLAQAEWEALWCHVLRWRWNFSSLLPDEIAIHRSIILTP